MGVPQSSGQCRGRTASRCAVCGAAVLSAISMVLTGHPVIAAGAATACCADLEMRVAELEAAAARTRGRTVELSISGVINRAILVWDDGQRHGAALVTNDNDNSVVTIEGEAGALSHGWLAGFVLDFDILDAGSGDISQLDQHGFRALELGELSVWLRSDRFGEVSIGKTSARGASSGANEQDLSGTEVAAYAGVTDVGGRFFLQRADAQNAAGPLRVKWDDVIDSLDEPDGNVVTYSSPDLWGLSATALWGEDNIWNLAAAYHQTIGPGLQIAAAIAVNGNHQRRVDDLPDHRTVAGSVSVLHLPTGLSLTGAGGKRDFIESLTLANGRAATPSSPHFYYAKAGWQGAIIQAGATAAYIEAGQFIDFLGGNASAATVESLAGLGAGAACTSPAAACLVSNSNAQMWGLGVVQSINQSEAQLYFSYRHFDADAGLGDASGSAVSSVPLTGLDTFMAGMLIEF